MALVFDHSMAPLSFYPNADEASSMTDEQMNHLRDQLSQYRVMLYSPTDDLAYVAPGEALSPRFGTQGVQGLRGFEGDRGVQGYVGNRGPQGLIGSQGIQGPKGDGATLSAQELADLLLSATNDSGAMTSLIEAIAAILASGDWDYNREGNIYSNSAVNGLFGNLISKWVVPIGTILPWVSEFLPQQLGSLSEWHICDGQLYSRTEYPELFEAIGTTYGAVNETNFRVPDFRGRFLGGVGPSYYLSSNITQSQYDATLGSLAGEATASTGFGEVKHRLIISELPEHSHNFNDYYQVEAQENPGGTLPSGISWSKLSNQRNLPGSHGGVDWDNNSGYSCYHGTFTTGDDQGHNNLPPYAVVKWIMRFK